MKAREALSHVLDYEPLRVVAVLVAAGVAGLTLVGVMLPGWAVALGGVLAAELARPSVTPVKRSRESDQEHFTSGLLTGEAKASERYAELTREFLGSDFLDEHTTDEEYE